jgi:hypothetical protein
MVDMLALFRYYVLLIPYIGNIIIYCLFTSIISIFRSNLTSPKWKNFRGSRIECQDKIRLNNVIWRTWHQQCKIIIFIEFFVIKI